MDGWYDWSRENQVMLRLRSGIPEKEMIQEYNRNQGGYREGWVLCTPSKKRERKENF